ncbi:D-alanyl-D-alanine carboxypeptidase/D-alanyl-D-alanine-endopeptidase [Candidatus Poribacteria bacterium]|nr:D-alanyl-D-alanine carboxypeptidase/D-alanyl-D-alanine-endopeptidase [Candidatus Poribacteria bacterium]MYA99035.1 D-alanyl-D-alanine carboxypeptidase/D-alanyl-D-alanine-endopeptidase [Candidatus Poribacteria bacterium]
MKNYAILLICVALLFSGCGILVSKPKPVETQSLTSLANPIEKLHTDIDAVLQETLFTTASVGIKVVAVETGEVVYEKNPYKLHHPASTTKLFTAATALAKLGSDYQFETTIYVDADADTQVVGDIYLKGRADPVLQPIDIMKLVDTLLETGLKSIQGDIVVDTTYLDTVREGPGWMWDDRQLRISALSIRQIEPEPGTRSRALACGYLLKNELIEKGIEVTGDVVPGTVPLDARTVAKHLSPPLANIIKLMNKPSDNWIAELLFKTIGAEAMGEPGTWQKGRDAVNEFLEEIMGEPPAHRFVDGSGLSRYNLLNAELLTQLLVYMYQNFELMPEYVASLPIAGVDGTLMNRMQGVYAERILRAKTGTLSGVSALAGYTTTADGEVFAFGILISHYVGSATPARDIQDQIGNYLTSFSRHPVSNVNGKLSEDE